MYKINVNNSFSFDLEEKEGSWMVNNKQTNFDVKEIDDHTVSILHDKRSYVAEVVEVNRQHKTCIVKVNGNQYSLNITDQFDELLHRLGMDKLAGSKISDLQAPMPGMVLKVLVKVGDEVKKGDNLLILEAMKMENIIKSPADLSVKNVKIKPGDKVEKNQVLISFQ